MEEGGTGGEDGRHSESFEDSQYKELLKCIAAQSNTLKCVHKLRVPAPNRI